MKLSKGVIIGLSATALVGIILISIFGWVNSLRNQGIDLEQGLSTNYEDNQNHLSAFISSVYEQMGIAKFKSAKLDTILRHAVSGRYGDKGFSAQGAFFAAVNEAYPNLTQLDVFDNIITFVSGGRENFRGRQSLLLDKLRIYEVWLRQGLIRHQIIKIAGFPSGALAARIGGKTVATGRDALNQMRSLVITGSTAEAFTTGRMEPMQLDK